MSDSKASLGNIVRTFVKEVGEKKKTGRKERREERTREGKNKEERRGGYKGKGVKSSLWLIVIYEYTFK